MSQNLRQPSMLAETIVYESGDMSMQLISSWCPLNVVTHVRCLGSHTFTFVSREPDTNSRELRARVEHFDKWPLSFPVTKLHEWLSLTFLCIEIPQGNCSANCPRYHLVISRVKLEASNLTAELSALLIVSMLPHLLRDAVSYFWSRISSCLDDRLPRPLDTRRSLGPRIWCSLSLSKSIFPRLWDFR